MFYKQISFSSYFRTCIHFIHSGATQIKLHFPFSLKSFNNRIVITHSNNTDIYIRIADFIDKKQLKTLVITKQTEIGYLFS